MDLAKMAHDGAGGKAGITTTGGPTPCASSSRAMRQAGDVGGAASGQLADDREDGHGAAPAPVAAMLLHNGE